mgnify:CR=1 FL=1
MSIDLPGFAESERQEFGENPESEWILALKIVIATEISGNFVWAAHSFGAYLAMSYIFRMEKIEPLLKEPVYEYFEEIVNEYNPDQLKGIILLDAWKRE